MSGKKLEAIYNIQKMRKKKDIKKTTINLEKKPKTTKVCTMATLTKLHCLCHNASIEIKLSSYTHYQL